MLNESRLLSFIDNNNEFSLHFIEGQKLVEDLALIHNLKGKGFAYFRDSVLSFIPLNTLLKHTENLGLYIDSKDPYFLLKIEMSQMGYFRTLLLPEDLNEFPDELKGNARLSKISQGQKTPYTSIIEINGLNFHQIVNQILKDSYQIKGEVILSQDADQAAFIMQLPRKNWDKEESHSEPDFDQFYQTFAPKLETLFKKGTNDEAEVIKYITDQGLTFLTGKDLKFKCNCSFDRMIMGIEGLLKAHTLDDLFEGKDSLETRCDYCKTYYEIPKSHFLKS